jgi:hypothetical protein
MSGKAGENVDSRLVREFCPIDAVFEQPSDRVPARIRRPRSDASAKQPQLRLCNVDFLWHAYRVFNRVISDQHASGPTRQSVIKPSEPTFTVLPGL